MTVVTTPRDAMRQVLAEVDVPGARRLWSLLAPKDRPGTDEQVLQTIHIARTAAEFCTIEQRAYSHRWLTERGLPSALPDRLRSRAERIYPKMVAGVGIAVKASSPERRDASSLIRRAMERAVLEADGDGRLLDSEHVRSRMNEARARERRALFGRSS